MGAARRRTRQRAARRSRRRPRTSRSSGISSARRQPIRRSPERQRREQRLPGWKRRPATLRRARTKRLPKPRVSQSTRPAWRCPPARRARTEQRERRERRERTPTARSRRAASRAPEVRDHVRPVQRRSAGAVQADRRPPGLLPRVLPRASRHRAAGGRNARRGRGRRGRNRRIAVRNQAVAPHLTRRVSDLRSRHDPRTSWPERRARAARRNRVGHRTLRARRDLVAIATLTSAFADVSHGAALEIEKRARANCRGEYTATRVPC